MAPPRNIRAHYDVGNEFYQLWLDDGMTYSSAMFPRTTATLRRAQNRKYDRILDRSRSRTVLEIGCGWGGFAERATEAGHSATGLTSRPARKAMPMPALTEGPRSICRTIAKAQGNSTTSSRSK